MASREPRPCGAAFSEWTTSPPPFAASAPLTPCRHEPANRAHSTRDPNDRQQTAYSSLSDADLWGKIRAERGRILDEFAAVTGFHRKHAMRLLRAGQVTRRCGPRPGRREARRLL